MSELLDIEKCIQSYEQAYSEDDSANYNRTHALRFLRSYYWLEPYLLSRSDVLELGGQGLFSYILKSLHSSITVSSTKGDLRFSFDYPDTSFDLILNMEVIEHIKDREAARSDNRGFWETATFSKTGVRNVFSECYRVLRAGGFMFLTTPNMNSLDNIHRILHHLTPINYYPHVREFSIVDLKDMAEEAGFQIAKVETFDSWNEYEKGSRAYVLQLLQQQHISCEDRGDNIFMMLKKPD